MVIVWYKCCCVVVQLLRCCLPLLNAVERRRFDKRRGFHLLSNQLHQHTINKPLADACLQLLLNSDDVFCDSLSVISVGFLFACLMAGGIFFR